MNRRSFLRACSFGAATLALPVAAAGLVTRPPQCPSFTRAEPWRLRAGEPIYWDGHKYSAIRPPRGASYLAVVFQDPKIATGLLSVRVP